MNRKTMFPSTRGQTLLVSTCAFVASLSSGANADENPEQSLSIELPGLAGPLPVSISSTGEATVLEYPKRWAGRLKSAAFSSSFGQKLDDQTCDTVSSRLRMFADSSIPSLMKDRIRESVRKESSITLRASSIPFLPTQEFSRALLDGAKLAGLSLNGIIIVNPVAATSYDVNLELSDKALSRTLGDKEALRSQVSALFGAGSLSTGETAGEFAAIDLACDLRSGAATMTLNYKGTVRSPLADRELISHENAAQLVRKLDARKGEFMLGEHALEARRNAFLAGVVLGEELRSFTLLNIEPNDKIAIFERFFSLSTGRPLSLQGDELAKATRVPSSGMPPFAGTATFSLQGNSQ